GLVCAERFGVLLSLPWLDLPAARTIVAVDAGHTAKAELLTDLVGALVLVLHLRLEAAAAVELPGPTHGLDGTDALDAADALGVSGDDLVHRLSTKRRRNGENERGEQKMRQLHVDIPRSRE